MSRFDDLPPRMQSLPVDRRGFPVPWFVAWVDGEPVFPAMDADKLRRAVRYGNCWVCGQPLGRFKNYVVGPMCIVNRNSSEPPSHIQCAEFSARHCPFLANPRMGRVPEQKYGGVDHSGIMLKRNPGVTAIAETQGPIFPHGDGRGGVLFEIKPISRVDWWAHGQRATRQEVEDAIKSGIPLLRQMAEDESARAVALLERRIAEAQEWLPKEVVA